MDDVQDLLTPDTLRGGQDGALRQHRGDGSAGDGLAQQGCGGRGCRGDRKGGAGLVERQVHRFRLVVICELSADGEQRRWRGFDFEVCGLRTIV